MACKKKARSKNTLCSPELYRQGYLCINISHFLIIICRVRISTWQNTKELHGKGRHPLIDGTESIVLKTFNEEQ